MNRVNMMGELAASLAHEINQPIAAAAASAMSCVQWLRRETPDIAEASGAASKIARDLDAPPTSSNGFARYTGERQQNGTCQGE
jgi:C4-dicarboxylate-specific signal transduction histidine kinase